MRSLVVDYAEDSEDCRALLTSIMTKDIGKDLLLAFEYLLTTRQSISNQRCNVSRYEAVEASVVSCIDHLTTRRETDVLREVGVLAFLSMVGVVTCECLPACLSVLYRLGRDRRTLSLYFLLLQLNACVGGEVDDWPHSGFMSEGACYAFRNVCDGACAILSGESGVRDACDLHLHLRRHVTG